MLCGQSVRHIAVAVAKGNDFHGLDVTECAHVVGGYGATADDTDAYGCNFPARIGHPENAPSRVCGLSLKSGPRCRAATSSMEGCSMRGGQNW